MTSPTLNDVRSMVKLTLNPNGVIVGLDMSAKAGTRMVIMANRFTITGPKFSLSLREHQRSADTSKPWWKRLFG